MVAASRKATSG